MLLHFAAAHRGPSICSCILQQLIDDLQRVPAFLQRPSTTFNEFLHFCNGHRRPSVSCCIFATANQGLGNAPAFLQRPIKALEIPAFCSSSINPLEMLLHFAATQSTPWKCSCILQQLNQGLGNAPAFCSNSINPLEMLLHFAATQSRPWMSSCIFETQSRMPIKLGRGWHE